MKKFAQSLSRYLVLVTAVVLLLALGTTGVSAGPKDANHCVTPDGFDFNEYYGVSDQILAFFCPQLNAGQHWTRPIPWFMNTSFESVPPEFVPAGDTPLEDFVAKFVAVKYVVDPGTEEEKTYVFPNSDMLWTGVTDGLIETNTLTLGSVEPQKVGQHVVEVYWEFSALHCDGLAANLEENCIPAGETLFRRSAFEVISGHH
jgi:hypothetical protein